MILHLCHHWFWITTLRVLLVMTVIARAEELGATSEPEPGRTNTSHPPLVRSKFKAVLFNVTRLYPVPDIVPDRSHGPSSISLTSSGSESVSSAQDRQFSTDRPNDERHPSSDRQWSRLDRVDKTLFASESVETRDLPRHPSDDEKPFSTPSPSAQSSSAQEAVTTADSKELLSDSDSSLMNANQSERLEREIRKNNVTQTVDTQESVRKISTTLTPLNNESNGEAYETEQGGYTIFVTPTSSYASSPNDLTTQTISTPATQSSSAAPVEVVKKSENVSKIKDKSAAELKAKYSSKTKDKTTPLKPVTPVKSSISAGATESDLSTTTTSTSSKPVQDLTSPTPVLNRTNINSSRLTDYEVLNDSPAVQENATELAFENTSISADYEEVNVTSPSSINISTISRTSSHGRMLDVAPGPQAHAEVLSNPWASQGDQLNVAMISGISFGALALVTLLGPELWHFKGAVSFIMYRRYRWNKPQTLSDKCSNPDSSGYIDDSTLRENSEEMYSLDNDSFLNSLEAMTIQNYWTDHVKHTKL